MGQEPPHQARLLVSSVVILACYSNLVLNLFLCMEYRQTICVYLTVLCGCVIGFKLCVGIEPVEAGGVERAG